MAVLTTPYNREARGYCKLRDIPVAAGEKFFKGAIVCVNAGGYAVNGADAVGIRAAGVCHANVDNTTGAAGDAIVVAEYDREFLFDAASITQAMVGTTMYIVDNTTVDDAAGPTNDIAVGKLSGFVSATQGWVYVPGFSA